MSTPSDALSTDARIGAALQSLPGVPEITVLPPQPPSEPTNAVFARLVDVTDDPAVKGFLRRILAVGGPSEPPGPGVGDLRR